MLIAAIAVIVFSIVGIATMTGVMPRALSSRSEQLPAAATGAGAPAAVPARPPAKARADTVTRAGAPNPGASAAAACAECGIVESIRAVEANGEGSGIGALAGGVVGGILGNQVGHGGGRTAMTVVGAGAGAYAGHEIEKNMNKSLSYQVRVRMNDGSIRTFYERTQPAWSVGQKVRVADNRIVARG
jgi:outer membrane lipoprotein SlyB